MILYFIIRLCLDAIVSGILIHLLLKTSRAFKVTRAKTPYVLYVPTLVSLVLILQVFFFLGPKVIDTVRLIAGTAFYAQVEVASLRSLPGGFTDVNGDEFYYNPLARKIEVGDQLSLRYLPNSSFVIQADAVGSTSEIIDGE